MRLLEVVRGNPIIDGVFTTASRVGDFSLIWHVVSVTRGIRTRRPDQVVALAVALGAESLIVNQGIKRIFRRARPTTTRRRAISTCADPARRRFPADTPAAAAFAATILSAWSRPRTRPLWWTLAAIVGTSRAYVRIHHASDVIGGAVVGAGLGAIAVRILRRSGMS